MGYNGTSAGFMRLVGLGNLIPYGCAIGIVKSVVSFEADLRYTIEPNTLSQHLVCKPQPLFL